MNITILRRLPPVEKIIKAFPLSKKAEKQVEKDRQEVKDILEGKDARFIVVVGPCSAWPKEAVIEYAKKLKPLSDKLKKSLKIVMRVYIQKPRTTTGWTGPVNQPDPFKPSHIGEGAKYCREMMVNVVEMGLPIADEAVFTHNAKGFIELLSWVAIGARSTEDQEHRVFASSLDCAVGMKNPTSGSIEIGVNSVVAAQYPHTAVFDGYEVQTSGNAHAHLILRGGSQGANYGERYVREAKERMEKLNIKNPAVILDVSHDNCKVNGVKNHCNQVTVVEEAIAILQKNQELREVVRGFMLESFLKEGSQKVDAKFPKRLDRGGLSITDPCLGFEQTVGVLEELAGFKRRNAE
ncbi:MAG: 3-deoxy-7-phosphoheptulonate synthase [Patescibacteria group bacterium]